MPSTGIRTAQAIGGAVDYFLKIDGIEGESQDSIHKGELQIESYEVGASQAHLASFTGGGSAAGKASFSAFTFLKKVDKSSPKLFLACANGQHLKSAVLVARKAGTEQKEYLKITLTEVLVSSYNIGGHNAEGQATDQVGFSFAKIEFEYKEQKPDGSMGGLVKTGYDLKQQKAS